MTDGWDDTAGDDRGEEWAEEDEADGDDQGWADEPEVPDSNRRGVRSDLDEAAGSTRRGVRSDLDQAAGSNRRGVRSDLDRAAGSNRRGVRSDLDQAAGPSRRRLRTEADDAAGSNRRQVRADLDEAAGSRRRRLRAEAEATAAADRRGEWAEEDGPEMPDAWRETEGWGEFSWGPEKRPGRSRDRSRSAVSGVVAVVAVLALAAAVVGLVRHQKKASTTTTGGGARPHVSATTTAPSTTMVTTPAGEERLLDATNQVSVAVPTTWKAVPLTQGGVATQLDSLATSDPADKNLIAFDLASLVRAQVGVFAIDKTAGATVFSYGNPSPSIDNLSQVPPAAFTDTLRKAGYRDVTANPVTLPIGPAEQVSAQTTLRGTTISELFDYFVRAHRVVLFEVSVRSTTLPKTLFSQIEATIAGT